MADTYSAEAKTKLKQLIQEGMGVLQETEDLREGLKDTVKAVSEELNIKAAVLNKAIRTAHKHDLDEQLADFEELEAVLEVAQRGRG